MAGRAERRESRAWWRAYIAQQMYPGIAREDLTEEQRQTLSALGTLAAGLAGGLAGGSTADTVAGAQAGKNAVENNLLGGGTEDGQVKAAQEHAKNVMSCNTAPGSASCQKGLAMQDAHDLWVARQHIDLQRVGKLKLAAA